MRGQGPGSEPRPEDSGPRPENGARLVAGGDREAFARFYDRYAGLVFTFAVRLLRSRAEAEDLVQDVFVQAWRQAGSYDAARGTPEAWLLTMCRSRGIDKLRSARRREGGWAGPPPEVTAEPSVPSGAAAVEARATVAGVLGALPEPQWRVLELAYFDGLTQTEIAARLQEPLGTVKTRTRAGLERLRGLLAGRGA